MVLVKLCEKKLQIPKPLSNSNGIKHYILVITIPVRGSNVSLIKFSYKKKLDDILWNLLTFIAVNNGT